jgi:hypothetical protein
MSDEQLLKEAEKIDRICKDLRRQAFATRRVRRSGSRSEVDEQRKQLDGLIAGVDSMMRALRRKYSAAAGPASTSGPGPSYAARQFKESLQEGDKIIAESRRISEECSRMPGDAALAPAAAAGDDDGGDERVSSTRRMAIQELKSAEAAARNMSLLSDEQLVQLSDADIRGYTDEELRKVAEDARAIRGAAEHLQQLQAEQAEALNAAEDGVDGAVTSTEAGRRELAAAARYKMSAMVMSAALVGGLIGGPVGAAVGAKSVAGVLACAAAGSATSVIATQQLSSAVQTRLNEQQAALTDAPSARRAIEDGG